MVAIPFEVESLLALPGRPTVVFARLLGAPGFTVSEASRLGGCAVLPSVSQPRAHRPDGSPRLDLFAFVLQNREDSARFEVGQKVMLEAARRDALGGRATDS